MIIDDSLLIKLSGGENNSFSELSIGGAISNTIASSFLFNSVNSSEITSVYEDYRCVYLHNTHETESIYNLKILTSLDESGDHSDLFISKATETVNTQAQVIDNPTTAPLNQIFYSCTNDSTALPIGTLGPNEYIGVWLKRTILANPEPKGNCFVTFFIKADIP